MPAKTWLRGEQITKMGTIQYKMNGWQFVVTSKNEESGMLDLVDEIIAIFEPKIRNFENLPKEAEVLLSCIVYPAEYCPALVVSA